MKKSMFVLAVLPCLAAGCSTPPIYLHTYDGGVIGYPDDFPTSEPTVLAFLDIEYRSTDQLLKPLRALSARREATLVGVMTYKDNAYLEHITTRREIVFPVMLDPKRKMFNRFGVSRNPTFILLSPQGKEVDRCYDVAKVSQWYKPASIEKAMGREHVPTPEEKVEDE